MGLLDLFRPRWKHSDPTVRMEAIRDLTPEDIVELGQVAKRDKDVRVRRLALKKINDPGLLAEIAESDADESLRKDAAEKRGSVLFAGAVSDEDESAALAAVAQIEQSAWLVDVVCRAAFPSVAQAALERLQQGRWLVEVVRKAKNSSLRKQALDSLSDDEPELVDLVCSDGSKELLLSALQKLHDPTLLAQIVVRAKLKPIRQAAQQKLPAVEIAAKSAKPEPTKKSEAPEPLADEKEREELCRKLEAAAKTEDFEAADEFLINLRRRFAELGPLPAGHAVAKRFERAAQRYIERKDVFLKKLAARNAGETKQQPGAAAVAIRERMEQIEKDLAERQKRAEEKRREQLEADEAARTQQEVERASQNQKWAEREAQRLARQAERDAELAQENNQRNAREQKRREDQQANLNKLAEVSKQLTSLAEQEELSLKEAEQVLKDAQKTATALGALPDEHRREARQRYDEARGKLVFRLQALREQRDWERWSNVPRLEALCGQAEELLHVVRNEADIDHQAALEHLKKLQSEWKAVGPTPKDKSEALWQRFKTAADAVFETVRSVGAKERDDAIKSREDLIVKVEAFSATEITDWKQAAETVVGLQLEWRHLAPIPHIKKEAFLALRTRFHAACDAFFEKRRAYQASIGQSPKDNERRKEELLARLERVGNASDVAAAAEIVRKCQAEWKLIGPAEKEQNKLLWQRFRKACDAFYARRKALFSQREAEWQANQKKKEEICAKAEALALREDVPQDTAETELKQLMADWRRIGPAPRGVQEELWKRFRLACDKVFSAGRDVSIPETVSDGRKFENRPLGALLSQFQAEQEARLKQEQEEERETGEDEAVPSAISPSQISDGWTRSAANEWNRIDEIISSGNTPEPEEEQAIAESEVGSKAT